MAISTSFWRAGVRKQGLGPGRAPWEPCSFRSWLGLGVCNVPPTSGLRFSWRCRLCARRRCRQGRSSRKK